MHQVNEPIRLACRNERTNKSNRSMLPLCKSICVFKAFCFQTLAPLKLVISTKLRHRCGDFIALNRPQFARFEIVSDQPDIVYTCVCTTHIAQGVFDAACGESEKALVVSGTEMLINISNIKR